MPLFGGSSAVWLTSLLFFQVALLAGYLFADAAVRKLSSRAQGRAHLALIVAAAATLPFSLPLAATNHVPALLVPAPPALQLLVLLALSVGLPFVALAATGPIAQSLWSRERSGSPYRLYALSNLASLLGLAAYPFAMEPLFSLHAQVRLFVLAFALFALAACTLAVRGLRAPAKPLSPSLESVPALKNPDPAPAFSNPAAIWTHSRRIRALWLLLPACSSALLISLTGHLTRNVAPIPLLWMVPLAAYLLSFILCFDSPGRVSRKWSAPLGLLAIGLLAFPEKWNSPDSNLALSVAAHALAFFFLVTALHGELVRLRPPALGLTRFYLSLSLGGALGSLVVAVFIPLVSRTVVELGLSLAASAILLIVAWWPELAAMPRYSVSSRGALLVAVGTLSLAMFISGRALRIGDVFEGRNFYGALRVQNQDSKRGTLRVLLNGNTTHGLQSVQPKVSREPLAYYSVTSGVGRAVAALRLTHPGQPLRIGAIGLGAGVLAGYCQPGDVLDFYEINPLDVQVAREQFTYLSGCPGVETRLGDARLLLAAESSQQFDLLVVDAFNSDSIPVHLLTAEAFQLYARHLSPNGILAAHVSNRYLDLESPIAAHAGPLGMSGRLYADNGPGDDGHLTSEWLLLSRDASQLRGPAYADASFKALEALPKVREWTDDYSNIAGAFR